MNINAKNALRREILDLLKNQKEEERLQKSKNIESQLIALPEFQKARIVLFYASFDGEVDTFGLMKQSQGLPKNWKKKVSGFLWI